VIARAAAAVAVALLLAACATTHMAADQLRVVTWNIHHGRGLDGRVDVARIAAELRALAPDLVLLQEVDVGVRRSGGVDLAGALAAELAMHAAFEQNISFQGGSYGNAVLSRWPVLEQHNLHYRMLRAGEQRGLLTVAVAAPSGPLAIGCTHIDAGADDAERMQNAPELLAVVEQRSLIAVGGDFNDLPGSRVHSALCSDLVDCWSEAGGGAGPSYPAASPQKRIDWLLRAPSCGWRAVAARVVPTRASDHCPVVFELARLPRRR